MKNAKDDKMLDCKNKTKQKRGHSEPEHEKRILCPGLWVGGGHCSINICQKRKYRIWAEVHASVGSTELTDSATRTIRHPQGGNVPFLKHINKNVIENV